MLVQYIISVSSMYNHFTLILGSLGHIMVLYRISELFFHVAVVEHCMSEVQSKDISEVFVNYLHLLDFVK